QHGIIALARSHGFGPALALFALTGIAFVWSSAFSKVPRHPSPRSMDATLGVESANTGVCSLIEQSVPLENLGAVAYHEWSRSTKAQHLGASRLADAQKRFDAFGDEPNPSKQLVSFYN